MPLPKPKTTETQPGKPEKASSGRKPWVKKTPADIIADQAEKLKAEIAEIENSLKDKRKQLDRLEQARKLFEAE